MKADWIAIGAAWGGLAVIFGAFGAHALEARLAPADLGLWHTGVLYHALHAPALILFGLFAERRACAGWPGGSLLAGSLVFSGTLYAMALGAPRWLGAITPVGGLLLILGWLGFAILALRSKGS